MPAVAGDAGLPIFPLSWSHYVRLMTVDNDKARRFYEAETLCGGWTVRQLHRQIGTQFYERTALSRDKAAMLQKGEDPRESDAVSAEEAIKDTYILEFLDLRDEYSESGLEEALIRRLEEFLLELGADACRGGGGPLVKKHGQNRSRQQREFRRRRGERAFIFDQDVPRCLGEVERDEWEVAISECDGDVAAAAEWCGLGIVPGGAKALWGRSAEEAAKTYRRWQRQRSKR